MDPAVLAKLVAEAKPLEKQLEPDKYLRIDVTTPIDIADLIVIEPLPHTIPIERSQILRSQPVEGTSIARRRGWLARLWDSLRKRPASV
jgi:hypothetical protein